MTKKERNCLGRIMMASAESMNPHRGERVDVIPPRYLRLFESNGWIEIHSPHNPAHIDRAVITSDGCAVLAMTDK